jgi:predicted acyltransferase
MIGSAIYLYTTKRGQQIAVFVLLLWYAVLMMPGGFDKETNFARLIDSKLLAGHMWAATKVWDPEGVISTIPAITTCLLGCLAGYIVRTEAPIAERATRLFLWGALGIAAGLALDPLMPINKNLWTGTYALFMAGLANVCFAMFFWLCDGLEIGERWLHPFRVYGSNAIVMFVASGMLARLLSLSGAQKWIWQNVYAGLFADPRWGSVAFALTEVLLLYWLAWALYRKGLFLRL